jgi:uncharacterized membrane protein SpoIIM required for sporulation
MVNAYSLLVVMASFWIASQGLLEMQATILAMSAGLTLSYLVSFLLARQLVLGRLQPGRPDADVKGGCHGREG